MTKLFKHASRPEWGMAQLIREEHEKRTFLFWDGQQRTFGTLHWNLMELADAGTGENAPATTSTAAIPSEGTDVRALCMHTRILGDPVTK